MIGLAQTEKFAPLIRNLHRDSFVLPARVMYALLLFSTMAP